MGLDLTKHSFKAALNDDKISIIRMDCTNYISTKIANNLDMECMVEKLFNEYVDDNGQPWINNILEFSNGTVNVFIHKKYNYQNQSNKH